MGVNASIGGAAQNQDTIKTDESTATLTYSTIVAAGIGTAPMDCDPDSTVTFRNSVVASLADVDPVGNCTVATSPNSAVIQGDLAVFQGATDFHLANGQTSVTAVAVREEGDPATDIDGDARPMNGYPGVDEPS